MLLCATRRSRQLRSPAKARALAFVRVAGAGHADRKARRSVERGVEVRLGVPWTFFVLDGQVVAFFLIPENSQGLDP